MTKVHISRNKNPHTKRKKRPKLTGDKSSQVGQALTLNLNIDKSSLQKPYYMRQKLTRGKCSHSEPQVTKADKRQKLTSGKSSHI